MSRPLNKSLSIIKNCLNCGKEFRQYKSQGERCNRRFCSIDCMKEYVRKDQFCKICGDPIKYPKSHHRIYCSTKCRHKDNKLSEGEAHKNEIISSYKSHAKNRNLEWNLSNEFIEKLFKGDCYWCGSPPSNGENSVRIKRNNGIYIYNGIDRIDSSKGYIFNNCVSCCEMCNKMKLNYTKEEFINKIRAIAKKWPK